MENKPPQHSCFEIEPQGAVPNSGEWCRFHSYTCIIVSQRVPRDFIACFNWIFFNTNMLSFVFFFGFGVGLLLVHFHWCSSNFDGSVGCLSLKTLAHDVREIRDPNTTNAFSFQTSLLTFPYSLVMASSRVGGHCLFQQFFCLARKFPFLRFCCTPKTTQLNFLIIIYCLL